MAGAPAPPVVASALVVLVAYLAYLATERQRRHGCDGARRQGNGRRRDPGTDVLLLLLLPIPPPSPLQLLPDDVIAM